MPKCFKCENEVLCSFHDEDEQRIWEMPSSASLFEGGATFGSAVYDSMTGGPGVEVLICDECLKEHKHLLREVSDGFELGEKDGTPFIKCKRCHRTSFNSGDIEQKYCGHCRKFHER